MDSIAYLPAKTIVTKAKNSDAWFGAEYNMNIYRGCCHGCIYCDSRSDCYRNEDFDRVKPKKDALSIIRHDLAAKRKKGVVATGAMSDPYNPHEKALRLTEGALALLAQQGFGVAIATKSDLVTRDIGLLREINARMPVLVKITITTPDNALAAKIEPHAPPPSSRFHALGALSAAGIFCGVLLMPTLPFITDGEGDIRRLALLAKAHGASFVYPSFGVTLRDNQREYYYARLDEHFPGLRGRYQRQYGEQYACGSPHAKQLQGAFREACAEAGLLYRMRDIIAAYQAPFSQEQTTLFQW